MAKFANDLDLTGCHWQTAERKREEFCQHIENS